jgi:hypothetical protein
MSSTVLYREFVLRSPAVWHNLVALVKANAKAMLNLGSPLRIIVTTEQAKRNVEQNKRLWGHVYKCIAEQAWVNGKQFSSDTWHEYFSRKHGVCDEVILPDGEIITRRKSTTQMTVSEFAEYMTSVEADAAMNLGVEFA